MVEVVWEGGGVPLESPDDPELNSASPQYLQLIVLEKVEKS